MKIGLIGNMNNNNFAIMRYFRDLGADAHLLLYKGDGARTLEHFRPEYDTWNYEKWVPYIHQTQVENGPFTIFGNPERLIFPYPPLCYLKYLAKMILRRPERRILPPSRSELFAAYSGYDRYIGSGLSPAILQRIGLALDIFYPYATGIEFLGSYEFNNFLHNGGYLLRQTLKKIAIAQLDGIKAARYCLNAEMSTTREVFQQHSIRFLPLAIPMVYNRETDLQGGYLPEPLVRLEKEIASYDFTIIMHARLLWRKQKDYTPTQWLTITKNNDWMLLGFKNFLAARPLLKSRLLILEYGPDVEATKAYCAELGIEPHVRWLPKMPRRELMRLISACDIGVGEFYRDHGIMWGGTGWEVLATGKPLLQSFRFDEGEFESIFGYPPPPMLPVNSPDCITRHLIDMADHPEKRQAIGQGAKDWFNRYNGIGLAQQWLDLLNKPN